MSRFLVTGGAGFMGPHLVRELVARGRHVRVLDDLSSGRLENLRDVETKIEWIEAHAADREKMAEAMKRIEGIFHLAAAPSVKLSIEAPLFRRSGERIAVMNGCQ